jgi:hypothetical protein
MSNRQQITEEEIALSNSVLVSLFKVYLPGTWLNRENFFPKPAQVITMPM